MTIELPENYSSEFRIAVGGFSLYLILPFVMMIDIVGVIVNNAVFPIVGIPKLKRSNYVRPFSRWKLMDRNLWYKLGCVYCSYANGVAYYFQAVAMKTEFLYCPWKQKENTKISHHRLFKEW